MSAVDVLALHQWEFDNRYYCKCRALVADHPSDADMAAHQLDALKAAGYAVVELPKPSEPRYPGEWSSTTAPAPDEWDVWLDGRRQIQVRTQGFATASGARVLAAALLAAADAAEKVEVPK